MDSILSLAEVDLFARAMYFVASVDGVDEREIAVIDEFIKDAGYPELIKDLDKSVFHPSEVATVLETTDKRRMLLKCLFVLVKADGVITVAERLRLFDIAEKIAMTNALDEIEASVAGATI